MSFWNALDLHMHTQPGITGDSKKENANCIINFSFCNFIESLKDVDIKLFSITNHNYVHLDNYILCKYLARKIGVNSLLGVELDIDDQMSSNYHISCIVDCDIEKAVLFAKFINEKSESYLGSGKKLRFDSNDIGLLLSKYRIVLIPHSPNKVPGIPLNNEKDFIELMKKVKEGYLCVLDEKSRWDLGYIKQLLDGTEFYKYANDIGSVFFSDNKDWTPGEYKKRLKHITCMNAEPTFKGLVHSLTNPTERFLFREYVPSYSNYISKIIIKNKNNNSLLNDSTISFKPGFNCVIGRSGSGKSLIIHLLKKYLLNKPDAVYSKYDNDGASITIYDENENIINANAINIAVGEGIFSKLIEAIDATDSASLIRIVKKLNPSYSQFDSFNSFKNNYISTVQKYFDLKQEYQTGLDDLISSLNEFLNNFKNIRNYMDLSIVNIDGIPSKFNFAISDSEMGTLLNYKVHFDNLRNFLKIAEKIEKTSEIKEKTDALEKEYAQLLERIKCFRSVHLYKMKKIDVVASSINASNRKISANAESKSRLEAYFRDNIEELSNKILAEYILRNVIKAYDLTVDLQKMKSVKSINKDGSIVVVEDIDDEFFVKASLKDRKVYNTYGLSLSNDCFYDLTKKDEAKEFFEIIYSSNRFEYKKDIVSQKMFSGIFPRLSLLFNGQDVKNLNSGDIAKTYLNDYFNNQLGNGKSVVIYDQLENDVDKEFIKNDLLNFLSKLKKRIQLIVVTHDPIIAVNGDPINYVLAKKEPDKTIKYRTFVPESEERDELETLANTVDGSKEVIRERFRVYKGENV